MRTRVLSQSDYIESFGARLRGATEDPETLEVYKKAAALNITERLVVEPDRGDDLKALRHSLQGRIRRLVKRDKLKAKIRFAVNTKANHVVVWKEPIAKAHPAATADVTTVRPNGRASAQQERSAA